jgi:ABC-type transport system involved in multi-copper enzyme maturation permease subunit
MNPVLKKDFLSVLRQRRVAAIQMLFAAVLALMVLATWPQQGVVSLASRGNDALLLGLILGQLVFLMLFVPGVAAVSITSEREAGTLEMLYASRLSAGQLIVGKLLSAIGYPLLLLTSGLPFVALLHYRGDADLATLFRAYGILLTSALLLTMLPLAISALCQQSATALAVAYAVVFATCGGVLVPAAIMLTSQGGASAQILHYVRSVSPIAAAMSLLRPHVNEFGGRPGGIDPETSETLASLPPSWQIFFPVAAVLIAVCLLILIYVLRKAPNRAEAFGTRSGGGDEAHRSLGRRIFFLIDSKKPRKPIGRFNPLWAKERRTNQLRSGRWMIRIFYGALFVSMGLALMAMYGGQTEHGDLLRYVAAVLVAFQVGLIVLIDPALTSASISSEREAGTLEMLRLTPLRTGHIFWGKLLPAFLPAMLPIIALLPAYGAVCFVDPAYVHTIKQLVPVLGLLVVLCCTTGFACSALFTNAARASACSYLMVAGIVVLPLLAWFAAGSYLDPRLASWLALPSALVMGLNLLPGGSPEIARLWSQHLIVEVALCGLMLLVARLRLSALLREGCP